MKKLFLFGVVLIFCSCENSGKSKFTKTIPEAQMEDVLYDLALLQAAEHTVDFKTNIKKVEMKTFLKDKYGLDSLTFVENNKAYAEDIKLYRKMNERVFQRLKQLDESLTKKGK